MKIHPFLRTMRLFQMKRFGISIFILVLAPLVFIPTTIVNANSAPPPTRIWIIFYDQNKNPTSLEGFQIIECNDENCSKPVLLDQYGECNGDICLKTPVSSELQQPLDCSQNKCLLMVFYHHEFSPYIKIIGQFREELMSSNLLTLDNVTSGGTLGWQVNIADKRFDLIKNEDITFQSPLYQRIDESFITLPVTLGITLIVEFCIAGIALWLKNIRNKLWWFGVGTITLVNFISYPTTWYLLPVLGSFQPLAQRNTGIISILATAIFTVLLVSIALAQAKTKRTLIILTGIGLPICFLVTPLILFVNMYSYNYAIAVKGLPTNIVILLSEIFAITFEGIMMFVLLRKSISLSLAQAFLLSLVMNSASYLVGLGALGLPFTLFYFG